MTKFKDIFNPKWSEFTSAYPEMTVLGLAWALYWRLFALLFGIGVIFGILGELFN
jgi:hypothetical protein